MTPPLRSGLSFQSEPSHLIAEKAGCKSKFNPIDKIVRNGVAIGTR
jgi:hypothetical protein